MEKSIDGDAVPELPGGFTERKLRRRALQASVLFAVVIAIALLAPGLGEVRDLLRLPRTPAWLALAAALEGLSFASYVVMFRPVFCARVELAPRLADRGLGVGHGITGARQWDRRAGTRRLDPAWWLAWTPAADRAAARSPSF